MHGAEGVIGAEDGFEEAAAEFEAGEFGLEGKVDGLVGEVADDDDGGVLERWCGRLADPDEGVDVVVIEDDLFAVADGGLAVVELDELAVEVQH